MNILVINAGSSSLKYQFLNMQTQEVLAKGNCERIGIGGSFITLKTNKGVNEKFEVNLKNHTEAFMELKNLLLDEKIGVIKDLNEVTAVGHRIVQGGSLFKESILIDEKVLEGIEKLSPLAPLHNPAHVQAIKACLTAFGKQIPQVAVFDTSFHSTMPEKAYMFPIPYEYYEKYQIRRYGFHGTSHRYVSTRCAELLKKDIKDLKIITCHLGNGSSISAIKNGKVIDTSMGLTPVDGFMMGTRCGTLDPSILTFLAEKENMSAKDLDDMINKKSGLLGISGISSDDRDITKAAKEGNKRAQLAHDMLRYEITKFVGGYAAALNGCDAIVFTAGLGENQASHRAKVCKNLEFMGVQIDENLNQAAVGGKESIISSKNSKIPVFVIPTNEELVIAQDTKNIVENL